MPVIILTSAVVLDLIFGEPSSRFHPTVWMGTYIRSFWGKCPSKKNGIEFLWGLLLVVSGVLLFGSAAHFAVKFLSDYNIVLYAVSAVMLKVSFSIRYLLKSGIDIKRELLAGQLKNARKLTAYHLVSRDTSDLTEEEICSCVIESLSENITDSFSSPVLYYLIFGLPGAWVYRFINTSDAMIAYRTEEFEWGGKFTAWCDSTLNWIPARFTAVMILISSIILPGASFRNSWKCLKNDRNNTASPNAGWTMSAMAGALGVTLQKKGEYTLAGGVSNLDSSKIDTCLKITVLSLILILTVLMAALRGGIWVLNMVA